MSVPLRIEETAPAKSVLKPHYVRKRRISRRARRLIGVGALSATLSILCLAGYGAATIIHGLSAGRDLPLIGAGSANGLSAVMGSARRADGYVTVTGSVSNIGSDRKADIEAVVELVDSQNRTVQVDKSMVAFASVPSGQTAPFRVMIPDDTTATGYRLTFMHPDGRAIE
jgi:hypothetical protein